MPAVVTPAKRALGALLAGLRKRSDRTAFAVADILGYSATTVSRYERGQAVPSADDIDTLLDLYAAGDDDRRKVAAAVATARGTTKRIRQDGVLPNFRSFLRAEADAESVVTLAPLAVPGLLQTEGYASIVHHTGRALADSATPTDRAVAARMARQRRLRAEVKPLRLHALFGEEVISRCVALGGTGRAQLDNLISLGGLPNVTLQVVPISVGAYGTMSGPTTLFRYPDPDDDAAVYLEYAGGGAWVRGAEVERYEQLLSDVRRLALPEDDTMAFINNARRT